MLEWVVEISYILDIVLKSNELVKLVHPIAIRVQPELNPNAIKTHGLGVMGYELNPNPILFLVVESGQTFNQAQSSQIASLAGTTIYDDAI